MSLLQHLPTLTVGNFLHVLGWNFTMIVPSVFAPSLCTAESLHPPIRGVEAAIKPPPLLAE